MNFLNPFIEIYLSYPNEDQDELMPFYREVLWLFSKNLNNRLRMFQHRVNIEIEEGFEKPRNFRFESIYTYRTSLTIVNFKKLDEHSKRKKILELVYSAFISLANEFNWDKEVITDSYEKCIEDEYQFVYFTDYKLSRNIKFKGRIRISLDRRIVIFSTELVDLKTQDLQTVELLKSEEGYFSWWKVMREFGWLDTDNFGLKLRKGQIWITANPYSNDIKETFKPKHSSSKQLEGYLKQLKGM